ncbi:MAG: outer membrane protein assembly factor BamA [Pseudobdellovibrionaceae bacterium]
MIKNKNLFKSICFLWLALLVVFAPAPGQAQSAEKIIEIKIEGQRKIEKDAILAKLKSKIGESYSPQTVREDVQTLFKLGYFFNIEVDLKKEAKGSILTYKVSEKPSMAEIEYEGNEEVKKEDLIEASGIKAYEIYNVGKVKEAVEKLQKYYEDKGFFLAKVKAEVVEIKKDESVKVVFKITESDKVKVMKITFLGNKKLSDQTLKSKMATVEGGYFSALSGSGQYKQEAFDRDVQILRFLYYNQGYVKAVVDRPQVYVTPDKKSIYITIKIEEGEQYHVGEVDIAGDILFPRDEIFEAMKIDNNDIFAYDVLQKDIADLTAKYGDLGYAYANVIPRTRFRDEERKVDLVFEFDKGQKVYFGKFTVIGNSKTRDKVVRREMKIREGELYNETRRRQSLENIQRLGFFEEGVSFKTSVDPERTEIMNIDVMVKERNTGQIQLGAGYGSVAGFTLQGSVQQSNFLGRGQNLGASLNYTSTSSDYKLSFTEPYFQDTLWSLGFDVYQSSNSGRDDYDESHLGGALRLGHPVAENTRGFLRYKYDKTKLEEKSLSSGVSITDKTLFPLETASGETSSVTATLEYDTRNDRSAPSKGIYSTLSYEYAGLGGQLKYNEVNAVFRYFNNIFWDVISRNSLQYSYIGPLQGENDVPFNRKYLLGGAYSLRGFQYGKVGKRVRSQKYFESYLAKFCSGNASLCIDKANESAWRPVGGTQQLLYQGELQYPLIKEAGIMGVVFYDIGVADDAISDSQLFSDVGFGIRWFSPIGPLRFEWGFPLDRNPVYHDPMVFEFSIGTPF